MALSLLGQGKRAVADLSQSLPAGDGLSPGPAALGYLDAKSGDGQKAQAIFNRRVASSRQRYVPPVPLAILSVGLNNRDEAFRQLRAAVTRHVPSIIHLAVDPVFDSLRSDPRYDAIPGDIGVKAGAYSPSPIGRIRLNVTDKYKNATLLHFPVSYCP
jgi:hypothetical protein